VKNSETSDDKHKLWNLNSIDFLKIYFTKKNLSGALKTSTVVSGIFKVVETSFASRIMTKAKIYHNEVFGSIKPVRSGFQNLLYLILPEQ
jgi:hypothetical protein